MAQAVILYPAATTKVVTADRPVRVFYGPMVGGFIVNPVGNYPNSLFVSAITQTPHLVADNVTEEIPPGGTWNVPTNCVNDVFINAAVDNIEFSAIVFQSAAPPTPTPGPFPPSGPTTLRLALLSYLYQEYNDDGDLQAFVDAFNTLAQDEIDWFAYIGLPVYTGLTGDLLDWVGEGLYGIFRPALPSGTIHAIGPLNTMMLNFHPINYFKRIGDTPFYKTPDDIYKRILTWNFYKGDGPYFTIRWLKRRIQRFLDGVNGTAPNVDQTYAISVTFGSGRDVNVDVGIYNPVLKQALDSGILQLPFQFNFIVTVG